MKPATWFLATLTAASLTLSSALAAEKPFSFVIQGDTLHIFAPDGKEVGTGFPPATIGKTVSVPPFSFQVSFGNDANGQLSVIVTPDPEHPTPVNFTINNREVQMERGSVVTVTVGDNGATHVDPGVAGGVLVDGHSQMSSPISNLASFVPNAGPSTAINPNGNNAQQPPASQPGSQTQNVGSTVNTGDNTLSDPTSAPLGLPPSSNFNSNGTVVRQVNNPQTAPSPTSPFA